MIHPLRTLLIATVCWPYISSRYVVQQPLYSPYSDYSYSYSGSGPLSYQSPFNHQPINSPLYTPPGTYFDQRQGVLRPFPGGGVPVLVDYHKRCSNQYVGLKAHPDQQQYYYVCKPDCVIFGKCQNLQIFNATCGQCVQHPPPEYVPTCTEIGRFPLYSDCHLYYKCEKDLQPKIYSCPASMIFSPANKKCVKGNKCTPTQISPHSSYLPEYCANKFPPCFENGIFRSPSDCSLYYKCDLKGTGVFIQTRLRCPQGNFYDLQKNECLPANEVSCDCIQVAELVYPNPSTIPFQPAMYPSQYDFDSLEESNYPVEQSKEDNSELNNNCNIDESKSDDYVEREDNTFETTISNKNEIDGDVLSDYTNIEHLNEISESKEFENLAQNLQDTTVSSEEITSEEGSGFETDSEETTVLSFSNENATKNKKQEEIDNLTEVRGVVSQTPITTDVSREQTGGSEGLLAGQKNTTPVAVIHMEEENKTMDIQEENKNTAKTPEQENSSDENMDNSLPTGTHTMDIIRTQNQNFSPKLTVTNANTGSELNKSTTVSESTRGSRSTLHKQNSANIRAVDFISNTPQLHHRGVENTAPLISENLESNLLNSEANLKTSKTIQSSKETATEQTTNTTKADFIHNLTHATLKNTSKGATPNTHTRFVEDNALIEDDVSYEDILDAEVTLTPLNEATKTSIVETTFSAISKKVGAAKEADEATTTLNDVQSRRLPFVETTTSKMPQTTIANLHLTIPAVNPSPNGTVDNQFVSLDSKNKIDHNIINSPVGKEIFPFATTNIDATKDPNREHESVTVTQVDFREEGLIPAHSTSTFINDSTDEITNDTAEKEFDDDYTTIIADIDSITSGDITADERKNQQQEKTDETFQRLTNTMPVSSTTSRTKENSVNVDSLKGHDEEVSNKEIASAETTETSFNLKQPFPHTPSNSLATSPHPPTNTTQHTVNTNPKVLKAKDSSSEPCEKHLDTLVLHVNAEDNELPSLDSPASKSLYYILKTKTKPVINNSNNNNNNNNNRMSNNGTAAALSFLKAGNENRPRLEIIAERPIDVHFSVCSTDSTHDQKNNYLAVNGKRAVLLRWFANKTNQTLGFETANEKNTGED